MILNKRTRETLNVLSYWAYGSSSRWQKISERLKVKSGEKVDLKKKVYVSHPKTGALLRSDTAMNLGLINKQPVAPDTVVYRSMEFGELFSYIISDIDNLVINHWVKSKDNDSLRNFVLYRYLSNETIPFKFDLFAKPSQAQQCEEMLATLPEDVKNNLSSMITVLTDEDFLLFVLEFDAFDFVRDLCSIYKQETAEQKEEASLFKDLRAKTFDDYAKARHYATKGRAPYNPQVVSDVVDAVEKQEAVG